MQPPQNIRNRNIYNRILKRCIAWVFVLEVFVLEPVFLGLAELLLHSSVTRNSPSWTAPPTPRSPALSHSCTGRDLQRTAPNRKSRTSLDMVQRTCTPLGDLQLRPPSLSPSSPPANPVCRDTTLALSLRLTISLPCLRINRLSAWRTFPGSAAHYLACHTPWIPPPALPPPLLPAFSFP